MTVALPPEALFGRVVGTFLRIVRDGTDSDTLPDASPCTGKIQFTPKQQTYKSSAPALVFYEPVSWWNT